MNILFLGDIFAKAGREMVIKHLPLLKEQYHVDFTIVNGENSAHGFGMTGKIANSLFEAGVDVITTGNHAFDNADMLNHIETTDRILRPYNWVDETLPGEGYIIVEKAGRKYLVINLSGQAFMKEKSYNPFDCLDQILENYPLKEKVDAIIVDIHAEATSEKQGLGHYADGRVSMLVGTHVHIPTADTRILPKGSAYQTDAGMCGIYDSVIGVKKEAAIQRMRGALPRMPFTPAEGSPTLCGVLCVVDPDTGLAQKVAPLRLGGDLIENLPFV